MKRYEAASKLLLTQRTPVIIRIDGRAFHTYTKGFQRPYDPIIQGTMQLTMKFLCRQIQGCVLGYTQSDEISLLIIDYAKLASTPWFDYNVQKIASVSASMATMVFNALIRQFYQESLKQDEGSEPDDYTRVLGKAVERGATFDARAFNVPREDVCNYFLWRQQDAIRNAINGIARLFFSDRELFGKNSGQVAEMLWLMKKVSISDYPIHCVRGCCCVRSSPEGSGLKPRWNVDYGIPIFKDEGRRYIDALLLEEEV